MRGIKIIINGQTSYLPNNPQTIALYQERNMLVKGTMREQTETATILEMSQEEVEEFLFAKTVPSTAGIPMLPNASVQNPDISALMALLITQQTELAELKKHLSGELTKSSEKELIKEAKPNKPKVVKPAVTETPAINLDKKIPGSPTDDEDLAEQLQDFS